MTNLRKQLQQQKIHFYKQIKKKLNKNNKKQQKCKYFFKRK